MKAATLTVATALLLGLALGCQNAGKVATTGAEKLYDLRATVVSLDQDKNAVTLDHEDIPGLMRAMKMSFTLEDRTLLEGLKEGDKVEGKLKSGPGGRYVVTELRKRG